jgi:hypothetical protein
MGSSFSQTHRDEFSNRAGDTSVSSFNAQINEIIDLEWAMFQEINEDGPRASCQDDPVTFRGMRTSQFKSWPNEAVDSYLEDLHEARLNGRNLVKEKYLYMMAESDPETLDKLPTYIEIPNSRVFELVDVIIRLIVSQAIDIYQRYPLIACASRPLYAQGDEWSTTSMAIYQRCELLTYSEGTLDILGKHIQELADNGESYVERVLTHTVQYYGYQNPKAAEEALERYAETHSGSAGSFLFLESQEV